MLVNCACFSQSTVFVCGGVTNTEKFVQVIVTQRFCCCYPLFVVALIVCIRGSLKFCQGVGYPKFAFFCCFSHLIFTEGRLGSHWVSTSIISRPSSAFRWWAVDGVIYEGEVVRTPCPHSSGSAHGVWVFCVGFVLW